MIRRLAHGPPGRACAPGWTVCPVGCPVTAAGVLPVRVLARLACPASTVAVIRREATGPPEAFPHRDLLVVDALERAGGAPHYCHRDHHILVLLWPVSNRRARGKAAVEVVHSLPPAVGWLSRSDLDTIQVRAKALGSAWGGCRISTAFLPRQLLRPGRAGLENNGPGRAQGRASPAMDTRHPRAGGLAVDRERKAPVVIQCAQLSTTALPDSAPTAPELNAHCRRRGHA